jgi:hypothetical protein
MRKTILVGLAAGALGLGLLVAPVAAAPIGGNALQVESTSLVEKVGHCFWRVTSWARVLVCPRHRPRLAFGGPRLWLGFGPFAFGVHRPYYRYHYRPYPAYYRFHRGWHW